METTKKIDLARAAEVEIAEIFRAVRGFPDRPTEPCSDLCGNQWCDSFGCLWQKLHLIRSGLAAASKQDATLRKTGP